MFYFLEIFLKEYAFSDEKVGESSLKIRKREKWREI